MKQLLQRLDNGEVTVADVPAPAASDVRLVVRAHASLISAGTERMLVEFGRGSLLSKARSQPEKVKQVLEKVRTDGLLTTLDAVQSKLGTPIALGYCSAGVVVGAGPRVRGFEVGDRVVTNGPHAEYVSVPHTLAAKIPDNVPFEHAAFTPVAAIGLQGVRLAEPTLGETVVVYGLGLIGLLTVQLLRANGCVVIGIDRNPARLALAGRFGATVVNGAEADAVERVLAATGGVGADAVLLTLASSSDEPIMESARMARKRGRLVLVGVTGLQLSRAEFFQKELTFRVSCSYGPGRYDPQYEDAGVDYPLAYVRWTEQRNFEAVLALMASGAVDPSALITHEHDIADATTAYSAIAGGGEGIGVLIRYPATGDDGAPARSVERRTGRTATAGEMCAAVVGAGNFAVRTLLPVLKTQGVRLRTIASAAGTSGAIAAEKFDFERATTDLATVWSDDAVNTAFILTRHSSHASMVVRALEAGKHVFVEKPLALTSEDLDRVERAADASGRMLMVGFNRRFAPMAVEARHATASRSGPLAVVLTVNAGQIPRSHWTQDPEVGGGRIVGEGCHFIDLARYLVGAPISALQVTAARDARGEPVDDVAHLSLAFADGSTAVVHYLANGSRAFPKERVDCFYDGKTITIDNWRRVQRFGIPSPSRFTLAPRQDKGHAAELQAWVRAVRDGGPAPIPLDELLEVSRWSVRAGELARGRA